MERAEMSVLSNCAVQVHEVLLWQLPVGEISPERLEYAAS
jgi:hypothetical protein